MRRFFPWLCKHLTAERLAVAAFLIVAVALWWEMQSLPLATFGYHVEECDSDRQLSPDGTLFLVHESRRDDHMPPRKNLPASSPWRHRFRVFDTATGQQVWEWNTATYIDEVTWTARNLLFYCVYPDESLDCLVQGIDPRQSHAPVFQRRCQPGPEEDLHWVRVRLQVSPDGNHLFLRQTKLRTGLQPLDKRTSSHKGVDGKPFRLELVDVRTGETQKLPQAMEDGHPETVCFSPDNAHLVITRWCKDGSWVEVYDVKTIRLRQRFFAKSYQVNPHKVAFSPDGRRLAVCESHLNGYNCSDVVRIWDVDTGKLLAVLDDFPLSAEHPLSSVIGEKLERFNMEVKSVVFLPTGQLCVATGAAHYELENGDKPWFPSWAPQHPYWPPRQPFWPRLHLFDATTYQRLICLENARHLQPSRDGSHVAAWTRREKLTGEVVLDLKTLQERADLTPGDYPFVVSGFGKLRDERDLYYIGKIKPVVLPAWQRTLRGWLGMTNKDEKYFELTFQDCRDGSPLDQWTFDTPDVDVIPSRRHDQLILCFNLGKGQELIEVYALPPTRPWLHIFGWAFATGMSVELLGLGWRRWRRTKSPATA